MSVRRISAPASAQKSRLTEQIPTAAKSRQAGPMEAPLISGPGEMHSGVFCGQEFSNQISIERAVFKERLKSSRLLGSALAKDRGAQTERRLPASVSNLLQSRRRRFRPLRLQGV